MSIHRNSRDLGDDATSAEARARDQPFRFCPQCGSAMTMQVPRLDSCQRPMCESCGYIHYAGPQLLVICAIIHDRSTLLIRRAIEPYKGKWAFPGGYVEACETPQQAAVRELFEEVGIVINLEQLMPAGITNVAHMNQVHLSFQVHLPTRPRPHIGHEVSCARWFAVDDLPADQFWLPETLADVRRFFDYTSDQSFGFSVGDSAPGRRFTCRLMKLS